MSQPLKIIKRLTVTKFLLLTLLLSIYQLIFAGTETLPISIFPLEHYSQDIDVWLSPDNPNYKTPLITTAYQQKHLREFYAHLFSTHPTAPSPWSSAFVTSLLHKDGGIFDQQQTLLMNFSNENKNEKLIGYGENYKPYTLDWINLIEQNMSLPQFKPPIAYKTDNRAIVIQNTLARLLPTDDPYFYNYQLPGQGYPFDNLAASAIWMGMPVYIVGESADKAWSLVITSSFISWVHSDAIARTTTPFVRKWTALAKKQLIAVTHTATSVWNDRNQFQFSAYVGSVFPFLGETPQQIKIAIPIKNSYGYAQLRHAWIKKEYAAKMPMRATPENMAWLIKTLQERPYGWGNAYFYNDCSAEIQALFTPFGLWLPRNSSKQHWVGKSIGITAEDAASRLKQLMEKGHPLMTIVYIGGHVYLYLGNYPNPNDKNHALMAMTYQTIWGLSPKDKNKRAIIGQSVLFPLLAVYPEDPSLNALYNTKFFIMTYLDEWPEKTYDMTELFFQPH